MKSGVLEPFWETGSEGVHWSVEEDGKLGYASLHGLRDGDWLRVFSAEGGVLFDGEVHLECKRNLRPLPGNPQYSQQEVNGYWVHGLQIDVAPETWAAWFEAKLRCEFIPIEAMQVESHSDVKPDFETWEACLLRRLTKLRSNVAEDDGSGVMADIKSKLVAAQHSQEFLYSLRIPTRAYARVAAVAELLSVSADELCRYLLSSGD